MQHLYDLLTDLALKLYAALAACLLILATLGGPKGPPSAPSAQLEFPFMAEFAVERKDVSDQGTGE